MDLVVKDRRSLAAARRVIDASEVAVETSRLKNRNLLPHALRAALWSVRPGGRIVVRDDSPDRSGQTPFSVPRGLIRQWVFRFIGRECRLVRLEDECILLERTSPVLLPGWSAGVVFSGEAGEAPALMRCVAALAAQPELSRNSGGEIVVCGPPHAKPNLSAFPTARYLAFELPPGPRFMIGQKKNFLMRNLANPRMAVLHARILLQEGALAAVPREFDLASPDVFVSNKKGLQRYLSLTQSDAVWPGSLPRREPKTMRDLPSGDPFALVEDGPVFVDGGAIYVTRPVTERCPMHDEVAWNEYEDVEWGGRALACGFISELASGSSAVSQTSKLKDWSGLGRAEPPARAALVAARRLHGWGADAALRLLGRR